MVVSEVTRPLLTDRERPRRVYLRPWWGLSEGCTPLWYGSTDTVVRHRVCPRDVTDVSLWLFLPHRDVVSTGGDPDLQPGKRGTSDPVQRRGESCVKLSLSLSDLI